MRTAGGDRTNIDVENMGAADISEIVWWASLGDAASDPAAFFDALEALRFDVSGIITDLEAGRVLIGGITGQLEPALARAETLAAQLDRTEGCGIEFYRSVIADEVGRLLDYVLSNDDLSALQVGWVLLAAVRAGVIDTYDDEALSTTPTTVETPAAVDTAPPSSDTEPTADIAATRDALALDALTLDPADEGGSHPTLSWQPVDGADSYWLVVHDADRRPYWSWTGSVTTVRFGGGDRAETNQTAALHDTMTWSVIALDAEGNPIALSDEAPLTP